MLPRALRLRKGWQFQHVYRKGRAWRHPLVTLHSSPAPPPLGAEAGASRATPPVAAFVASKKVGKAVVRNKVRRRLSEAYRLLAPRVKPGQALVFTAKPGAEAAAYPALADAVAGLLGQAGLLAPPGGD